MKTLQLATLVALLFCSVFSVMALDDRYQEENQIQVIVAEPININSATIEQFMLLKGVGQKKAQAIVSYREINGAFVTISDLTNVKGIGEKLIEANRSLLTM